MGDAVAHLPGADHADVFDIHRDIFYVDRHDCCPTDAKSRILSVDLDVC